MVASASLNLSRNSFQEKCYFIASATLKIKCDKPTGMQEKVSIMGVWCGQKNVTRDHCSASLGKPRDADQ